MGCVSAKSDQKKSGTNEKELNKYEVSYDTIPYNNFITESTRDPKQDYQFGNQLGQGTYGTVIKVKHITSGEIRAMKKILKSSLTSEERARKIVNDIMILMKLAHPNILKIFEFYQDQQFYYVTMEYYQGGELFEKLHANNHLCENEAANAIRQVLEVINYSNTQNIAHRDIKPENIMIDQKPAAGSNAYVIKVIDWGCAAVYTPGKHMTALVGTPYYIAPEVINRRYTEKADVYSTGAVLYQLLCGEPPYNADSVDELLKIIKNSKGVEFRSSVWKEVSPEGKEFIKLLMEPDSAKRISATDALKHKWLTGHAPIQTISKAARDECVSKLKDFRAKNEFLDAVEAYISQYLTSKEEHQQYTTAFKNIDQDGNGTLTIEEIEQYFSTYMTTEEVQNILKNIDKSKDGRINYVEFVTAIGKKLEQQSRATLRRAFDFFDKDKDGFIDLPELKLALRIQQGGSTESITKILQEIDTNHDGKISFEEFVDYIPKYASKMHKKQSDKSGDNKKDMQSTAN